MNSLHPRGAAQSVVSASLIVWLLAAVLSPEHAHAATAPNVRSDRAPASSIHLKEKDIRWSPSTMGLQALGGLVVGAGGTLCGMALGMLVGEAVEKPAPPGELPNNDSSYIALLGAVVGGTIGMSAGTWIVGEWVGADGRFGWTVAGTVVGATSGVLVSGLVEKKTSATIAVLALSAVGGVVGYHLTLDDSAPSPVSSALRFGSDGRVHVGIPVVAPRIGAAGLIRGWRVSLLSGRF